MPEQDSQNNQSISKPDKASKAYPARRNRWRSSLDALKYIYELTKKPELQIRESDRITGAALLLATIATLLCLLLHNMSGINFKIMGLCDFFLGISLIIYVFNRLGILTALPPRQAVLTWQLIRAFTYVGIFIAINLAIFLSLILSKLSLGHMKLPCL